MPPSASVSELGGTGIASSLVWSQYGNLQAWMPHVAQRIQVHLNFDGVILSMMQYVINSVFWNEKERKLI